MAIPALALAVVMRAIANSGVKEAVKKYGKEAVKQAQKAKKDPDASKEVKDAVTKFKTRHSDAPKELPKGMKVERNTVLNKGGMVKANCGASVPPAQKSSKGNK